MPKKPKMYNLTVRVSNELRRALERAARDDGRALSKWLRIVLARAAGVETQNKEPKP